MTVVIAKITDANAGAVTLFSDTKITDRNDDTASRRTLSNPGQKVVIVDDEPAVLDIGRRPRSTQRSIEG